MPLPNKGKCKVLHTTMHCCCIYENGKLEQIRWCCHPLTLSGRKRGLKIENGGGGRIRDDGLSCDWIHRCISTLLRITHSWWLPSIFKPIDVFTFTPKTIARFVFRCCTELSVGLFLFAEMTIVRLPTAVRHTRCCCYLSPAYIF